MTNPTRIIDRREKILRSPRRCIDHRWVIKKVRDRARASGRWEREICWPKPPPRGGLVECCAAVSSPGGLVICWRGTCVPEYVSEHVAAAACSLLVSETVNPMLSRAAHRRAWKGIKGEFNETWAPLEQLADAAE